MATADHIQFFGQGVEIAVLFGIFYRVGGLTATVRALEIRLKKLEELYDGYFANH